MIYDISDNVPMKRRMLFAIQMVLSVFVASVLIANICGVSTSGALVGAGLATLTYLLVTGFKSPMFLSNSGAFVAPVIFALRTGGYTGVLVGGITTAIIYCAFGIAFKYIPVEKIYDIFPKALIGAVTVVIGINLMSFIPTYLQINGEVNGYGISVMLVTMFAIAIISYYAKGIWQILPFLLGTLIGYAYAVILTVAGIAPIVDFTVFENLALFMAPDYAFLHFESIDWAIVLPIVIMYAGYTVSAMMECLSDHAALGNIIGTDLYQTPGLSRIFCGEGIANIVGSFFGGLGICSYGEGVACVGFSKVAATEVTATAAGLLIILGMFGPVQAFIASIPSCVFAGAAVILYGFIAGSGAKMLQQVDLNVQKNLIIVSVVLSLGVSGITILGFSGTALGLIVGFILNILLHENKRVE